MIMMTTFSNHHDTLQLMYFTCLFYFGTVSFVTDRIILVKFLLYNKIYGIETFNT